MWKRLSTYIKFQTAKSSFMFSGCDSRCHHVWLQNIGVHVSWVAAVLPGRWHKINKKSKNCELTSTQRVQGPTVFDKYPATDSNSSTQITHMSNRTHAAEFTKVSALPTAGIDPDRRFSEEGLFSLFTVNSSTISARIVKVCVFVIATTATLPLVLFFIFWETRASKYRNTWVSKLLHRHERWWSTSTICGPKHVEIIIIKKKKKTPREAFVFSVRQRLHHGKCFEGLGRISAHCRRTLFLHPFLFIFRLKSQSVSCEGNKILSQGFSNTANGSIGY